MIDIKLIIDMLQTSDITSGEVAIAKGRKILPFNYNEFKQLIKIKRNGY